MPVVSSLRAAAAALLVPVALLVLLVAVPTSASARLVAGDGDAPVSDARDLADVLRASARATRIAASAATARPAGVWPLLPRPDVVAHFEPPAVRWGAGHRGVDLGGHVGQPVRAALGGTVTFVGRIAGRGVVVVDHGRTRTTYQPVLATASSGDRVTAGDVIGRLSGAGSHCAPRACLHWGLRRGETYLDPLTLVDAPRPVRLLPW